MTLPAGIIEDHKDAVWKVTIESKSKLITSSKNAPEWSNPTVMYFTQKQVADMLGFAASKALPLAVAGLAGRIFESMGLFGGKRR